MVETAALIGDADVRIGDPELTRIIRLVYDRSGITLHEGKRTLVEARLRKRLRTLGCATFAEYLRHVEADATGQAIPLASGVKLGVAMTGCSGGQDAEIALMTA